MATEFACPYCLKPCPLSDASAGQQRSCPHCGKTVTIPHPTTAPAGDPPPNGFKLAIDVYVRETAEPEEVTARLVALYEKLNEYSLLKYGRGLTVEEFEQYIRTGARAPVGC
jgi:hypothetical protein